MLPTPALSALVALAGLAGCAALVDTRADRRESAWMQDAPPVGQFVEIDGRQVHLVDTGPRHAPAVVLIHGANGNLRDFTYDLVGRLQTDYRVIAVDRPGLGWSDSWGEADSDPAVQAEILRRAVASLGVARSVVVGHSYGGAVAMGWALGAPESTTGVVLLAGATHPWDGGLGLWYRVNESRLARPARAMVAAFAPGAAVEATLSSVFSPTPVPQGYAEHFGPGLSLRRSSQANNTRQVNALLEHVTRMQPGYSALPMPVEILHGTADTIVGLEIHARRMAEDAPRARLTVIEGGGHMPHHSHPDLVVDAIRRVATGRPRS